MLKSKDVIFTCHRHGSEQIQALGLSHDLKTKSETGQWLTLFFGIMFLEQADREEFFSFSLMPNCPQKPQAHEFADSIWRTPSVDWPSSRRLCGLSQISARRGRPTHVNVFTENSAICFILLTQTSSTSWTMANIQAKTDIKIRGSEVVQPLQRRDDHCPVEMRPLRERWQRNDISQMDFAHGGMHGNAVPTCPHSMICRKAFVKYSRTDLC